jgi:hypothetical protein
MGKGRMGVFYLWSKQRQRAFGDFAIVDHHCPAEPCAAELGGKAQILLTATVRSR